MVQISEIKKSIGQRVAESPLTAQVLLRILNIIRLETFGSEYLTQVRNHLDKEGSVLAVFNHLSVIDPGIIYRPVLKPLENHITANGFPTSMKFMDDRMGYLGKLGVNLANQLRLNQIQIVQHNDRFALKKLGKGQARAINNQAIGECARLLKTGRSFVAIAPEGTRSRTGVLIQSQGGGLNELLYEPAVQDKVIILPVALMGTEKFHSEDKSGHKTINPLAEVYASIGQPLYFGQLQSEMDSTGLPIQDVLMLHIASGLDYTYLGYYGKYKDFINQLKTGQPLLINHSLPNTALVYKNQS